MGKSIHQLIPDIYELVSQQGGWDAVQFDSIAKAIKDSKTASPRTPSLRMSQLGPRCHRALWYSIHHPELAEPLPPQAIIKYTYGHIIESMIIELAKACGHDVTGEQDELHLDGIVGHRDCIIDGAIVDVKSASSRGFKKFKDGTLGESDDFGYLDQLDAYVVASLNDPLVRVKDRGYDLAVDKSLGHLALYEHRVRPQHIKDRIRVYREIVSQPHEPNCSCGTTPDGESGNIKLDTKASYSSYKFCCFPSLRTFLYSDGPRYLTRVVKKPMYRGMPIPEVDKHGHYI